MGGEASTHDETRRVLGALLEEMGRVLKDGSLHGLSLKFAVDALVAVYNKVQNKRLWSDYNDLYMDSQARLAIAIADVRAYKWEKDHAENLEEQLKFSKLLVISLDIWQQLAADLIIQDNR